MRECVAGIKMQSHSWQTNNKTDLSLNPIEKEKEKKKAEQNGKAKERDRAGIADSSPSN